jgi:hypothetical protein
MDFMNIQTGLRPMVTFAIRAHFIETSPVVKYPLCVNFVFVHPIFTLNVYGGLSKKLLRRRASLRIAKKVLMRFWYPSCRSNSLVAFAHAFLHPKSQVRPAFRRRI